MGLFGRYSSNPRLEILKMSLFQLLPLVYCTGRGKFATLYSALGIGARLLHWTQTQSKLRASEKVRFYAY